MASGAGCVSGVGRGARGWGKRGTGRAAMAVAGFGVAVLLCGAAIGGSWSVMSAQTLARPGWAGSGMTVDRWWKHAVVVEVDLPDGAAERSATTLQRTAEHLDEMRGSGVDAVLLRGLGGHAPMAAGAAVQGSTAVSAAAVDRPDVSAAAVDVSAALDELVSQSGRRGIRVLVEVRGDLPAAELASTARMWLNHGVAGVEVVGGGAEAVRAVRGAMRGVRGDRLLVRSDVDAPAGAKAADGAAELRLVPITGVGVPPDAASVRSSVESASANGRGGGVLLDAGDTARDTAEMARVRAAVTLLSVPGAALLDQSSLGVDLSAAEAASSADPNAGSGAGSGAGTGAGVASRLTQTRPTDEHSVAAQTRQMIGLHHDRAAFLTGTTTVLDHDAAGAAVWLRRGAGGNVLAVVGNLAGQPLRLSLADDVARLRLRGTFLKTISRSDNGLGAMPLDAVTVPAYGVYVGELSR